MWMIAIAIYSYVANFIILVVCQASSSNTTNHQYYWYTAPTNEPNQFTGNRILSSNARGNFSSDTDYIDVTLPSNVKWIVATTITSSDTRGTEPQFVVTTEDGPSYIISSDGHTERMVDYPTTTDEGFSADRPPLVLTYQVDDGNDDSSTSTPQRQSITKIIELPQSAKLSILSHPVHVFQSTYIYINTSGNIVLYDIEQDLILNEILNVNALLDGRIVVAPRNPLDDNNKNNNDDDDRGKKTKLFAVYAGATSYSHCVLGDCLEGSSLLFIQVTQQLNQNDTNGSYSYSMTIERNITLPSGTVYEGVSPMFIENGETIVTTVANTKNGAWLRTYNVYCGDIISESSHLGWGWRHVLFYNNFAPIIYDDDSTGSNGYDPLYSLVDVLTPHVRKELESLILHHLVVLVVP